MIAPNRPDAFTLQLPADIAQIIARFAQQRALASLSEEKPPNHRSGLSGSVALPLNPKKYCHGSPLVRL